ncbi:autotransporter domain-containing protein [Bradyrhizobium sp. CNPSo 4010]|uniref:Autotransporter domain-containing protein n=1 Tax=Bradyrhizobium agreste TaxID=2751811 RepID=A0ABS0PNV4_9BRAD|nr:autotransporter domain-containing protein [Bradyrhizobium agreste]
MKSKSAGKALSGQWWCGYALAVAAIVLAESASAQTGFIDTTGYGFVSLDGPIVVNQAFGPGQNIAGIVQLAPNPLATVTQTGFYNRTAIIQVDATNTAAITQAGDFSHAYVIQIGPTNASAVAQTGNSSSAIVIQLAASPIAALGTGYLQRVASNLLFAPETAAALPSMAQLSGQDFSRDLFSQLDTGRGQACLDQAPAAPAPLVTKAPVVKAPPIANPCRIALFVQGNYHHGDRADAFGSTKYSYDSGGVLAGAKFYITPNVTIGPTFGYTRTAADFRQGLGSTDLDSYHLGGFFAYDTSALFVHAVAAYGWNRFDVSRTGFGAPITPRTDGNTSVAAIKAGYLFDVGLGRLGPIGGFTYSHTRVDGYSETGDPFLTQMVAGQSLQSAVVSGGIRFQPRIAAFGARADSFVDVTVEKDLRDATRVLQTTFTLAPGVPIFTPVRPFNDTYVRIAGGIGYDVSPNARLTVSAEGLVASRGANSVGVNAGLRFGF